MWSKGTHNGKALAVKSSCQHPVPTALGALQAVPEAYAQSACTQKMYLGASAVGTIARVHPSVVIAVLLVVVLALACIQAKPCSTRERRYASASQSIVLRWNGFLYILGMFLHTHTRTMSTSSTAWPGSMRD